MKSDSNKSKTILIVIFSIILIILLIYNSKTDYNNGKEILENNKKVQLLDDYNRFFTVNSCIYKYITYIQSKDVNSILKVLNEDYINKNSINENNVLNYVEDLNGNYSFKSKKIYYEEINDNVLKFYVYGQLSLDTIDGYSNSSDRYYIVMFDIDNQLFDITPYDKEGFEEVSNDK